MTITLTIRPGAGHVAQSRGPCRTTPGICALWGAEMRLRLPDVIEVGDWMHAHTGQARRANQ